MGQSQPVGLSRNLVSDTYGLDEHIDRKILEEYRIRDGREKRDRSSNAYYGKKKKHMSEKRTDMRQL
ncbi:MAG: hypothetical protein F6K54_22795 [Okeania sp. SIO3B5]|uniref:hypothetical protein n=1 Tax=Okeania sp. SIO3B5 TaxID=2607811 RepID=UPI0013FE7624|nr:hypothetical protein [Okeania sp. SIO3B5]NEO55647.1 hypothetical protein [Okeania sp. SIO3B5]